MFKQTPFLFPRLTSGDVVDRGELLQRLGHVGHLLRAEELDRDDAEVLAADVQDVVAVAVVAVVAAACSGAVLGGGGGGRDDLD